MKPLFIILIALIVSSCNKSTHEQSCYVDILNDVTDPIILRPQAQSILELFNLSQNKNEGANFRYSEIKDLSLVPVTSFGLPDQTTIQSMNIRNEPLFREKLILNFYDSIRRTLSNIKIDSSFLNNSECYHSICKELNVLVQSRYTNKVLIVFSNLFEHSNFLDIYSKNTKNLIYKNPEKIKLIFQRTLLLPYHLSGITVVFVYQPKNRNDDELFNAIVNIYKSLLEERGAKVIIQATNTHYTI